jgi:hypothetical protein
MFAKSRSLVNWIRGAINRNRPSSPMRRRELNFQPWAEILEDRNAPAVFYVTNLDESTLDEMGVLGAAPAGSLRAAVKGLTADVNTDTDNRILFSANLNGTINLVAALPDITKSVQIIEGVSTAGGVTISKANPGSTFRIFTFDQNPGGHVLISGFTITNGWSTEHGGGILARNLTSLTLRCTKFVGNHAVGSGGALFVSNVGTLDIEDCRFRDNVSDNHGGAIAALTFGGAAIGGHNISMGGTSFIGNEAANDGGALFVSVDGNLGVYDCFFRGNVAFGGDGGAIRQGATALGRGTLTLIGSEFYGNTASGNGGAYADPTGLVIGGIANSTMNGNSAGANGTIYNPNRRIDLFFNTISQNSATNGGGVYVNANAPGAATIINSIIANNTASVDGPDVFGLVSSGGHNLIGDDSDSTGWIGSDLLNEDPLLGPLGYHGGRTRTMLLLTGSPAIDAIDASNNGYASSTDQRGFTRIVNSIVDIGAVEMQSGETSLSAPFAYNVSFNVALGATLTVTDEDDNPNLLDYSGNADDEYAEVFEVDGEDEDVGEEIETANGGLLTIFANGDFTYIAPDDFVGNDSVNYTIKSGVSTRSGTITFHITNTSALDASFSVLKNQTLTVTADPQGLLHFGHAASGDPLTVTKVNGSSGNIASSTPTTEGGAVTVQSTGAFVYIPDTDFTGFDTFTFTISDGLSESTATVTIHVTKVLAGNASFTTLHDVVLTVPGAGYSELLVYAADADDDPLTVVAINGDDEAVSEEVATAMGGTVTVESDGSLVYTPPASFAGLDWFTYTVSDGSVTSTAYAFLNVTNTAPVAINANFSTLENTPLSVPNVEYNGLLDSATDGDEDVLFIVAINGDDDFEDGEITVETTQGGSVTVNVDGSFVYTPPANWTGYDTFTFTVSDGIATDTKMVTIHVT